MIPKNIQFLAREKGVGTTDILFSMFCNEHKELADLCAKIASEERELKKTGDSRFNPERLEMAESIIIDFLSSLDPLK